jgi:hypothetical protein
MRSRNCERCIHECLRNNWVYVGDLYVNMRDGEHIVFGVGRVAGGGSDPRVWERGGEGVARDVGW